MTALKFILNTTLHSSRPIFEAYINTKPVRCMLDTGADIPVFCGGIDIFRELFKDTTTVTKYKDTNISGFGKSSEQASIWNFSKFRLSDSDGNSISYCNLKCAVVLKPSLPCDLILSASMFMKMCYKFNYLNKDKVLTIKSPKEEYGVGFNRVNDTIYIFLGSTNRVKQKKSNIGLEKAFNKYINSKD